MSKNKKVFVRDATGLVREWSVVDGLFYNILAITIPVAFALIFSLVPFTFSGADIVSATLLSMLLFLPMAVTYAMMATTMPRTGGDYVFQSRALHPAIGFMTGFAFLFVLDALFVAIDGVVASSAVISPLLAVAGSSYSNHGLQSVASWFAGSTGEFAIAVVTILFAGAINLGGLRLYGRSQRAIFIIGLIGAIITIAIFASYTNDQFISSFNNFAKSYTSNPDPYHSIINNATSAGFATNPPASLKSTFLSITILAFGFTGIIWSVQNGGEIKSGRQFRSQLTQMVGALLFGGLLLLALAFFITRTVGTPFLSAAGYLYFTGSSAYPIPIAPYFSLFALVLNSNPIIYALVLLWSLLWLVYAQANGPLGGTRFMLAASFDRTFPARFGDVSDRFHVPSFSLTIFTVLTIAFAALYVFVPSIGTFTLDLIFGIVVMELFTCLSAAVLPYSNREIYQTSPVSRYNIAGIPAITVSGVLSVAFLVWLVYEYATVSTLGVNSLPSAIFLIALYIGGLALYFVANAYRKSKGVDLRLAFREIPPE